jgi:alkylation response protein AidB-like acyl-CoA dehydrogenase
VVAYALAMMEIARGCASTAVTMAVTNMVGEVIARFGSDAQKQQHVTQLTSGAYVAGAFALSEPGAGSDPAGMTTQAIKDGDGWVLNGHKQWITSGSEAGVMVVWARTDSPTERIGHRGISCFLVERGAPGLKIGKKEDKLGLRASETVALSFEDCRLGGDALLGELGQGFKIAMMALDGGRIGIASQAIGIASAAQEEAVAYAKERKQFDKPIADFQAIQWMIADSATELDAARLLTLRAAAMKSRGDAAFSREAAIAKLFASETGWRVCDRALQIHGGYGYVRDFAVERHLRDVRVTRIYEGTSEIQRTVIARTLLRG